MRRGAWCAILAIGAAGCHDLLAFGAAATAAGPDLPASPDAAVEASLPPDLPPPTDASLSCQALGSCFIEGTCYQPGVLSPLPCRVCDPARSQTAWSLVKACVLTLAGSGAAGFQDGPAGTAQFNRPQGVALLDPQTLLVVDNRNHCVRRLDLQSGVVGTFAGVCGTCDIFCHADGPAATARFFYPGGIAISGGKVFITDTWNHRIRLVTNGWVSTVAGSPLAGTVDGPIATAKLSFPEDVAIDAAGVLYFIESASGKLRRIANGQVTTYLGTYATLGAGPQGVTVPPSGNPIYVSDTVGQKIWQVVNGVPQGLSGLGLLGCDDGSPIFGSFAHPTGLALTATDLLVADWLNSRIRKVALATGAISTLAGASSCADGGAPDTPAGGHRDGALAQALFRGPRGLYLDAAKGHLYIGDERNHRVRLLVLP